ncbi:MAG: hypothetical protein ABJL17_05835 [Parvibaculum sp.]|uniref:hypothetical protein n=1 Tax=Parvibaculum sp. TaxID=2024848 RepID=UPI0032671576
MSDKINESRKRPSKRFTLGRQAFVKISEIEGFKMSPTMEAEFQEFDKKGLSAEERRRAIARKFRRSTD